MSLGPPADRSLRTTFNQVASTYGQARPNPPPELFDELVELTRVPPGGRVLEIGCGTGIATVALARRGYQVVAVELGGDLAVSARQNLALYPNVDVEHAAFEEWSLPAEPFDVVTAFSAWHWLDPDVALGKAARALRPGGALAIVGGEHVAGGDTNFFNEMQGCYERFMPGTPTGLRLRDASEIPPNDWGTAASEAFEPPQFRRFVQVTHYTTATYLDLLRSFSGHIALAPNNRDALFACVEELLEGRFGGQVRRATLTELCVARRR
jgi:protein-L-isoaspartate O-methyltransferase